MIVDSTNYYADRSTAIHSLLGGPPVALNLEA
jgi:hypothetical protein